MTILTHVEQLEAIYGTSPSEASIAKVTARLTPEYRQMIEASPFVALATVAAEGLDARRAVISAVSCASRTRRRWRYPTGAATTASTRCAISCAIRASR